MCGVFTRNGVLITTPAAAWETGTSGALELLDGSGRVRSGFARMGCTVSFICCEEDFLQMPVYHHEDEKKKGRLRKVKVEQAGGEHASCHELVNMRAAWLLTSVLFWFFVVCRVGYTTEQTICFWPLVPLGKLESGETPHADCQEH